LIPVRDFFADQSSEWGYRISPSGKFTVNQAIRRTKKTLIIRNLDTRRELASIKDYSTYFWNPHEDFLHIIRDKRMWKIDPNTPAPENWLDVTPLDFQNGYRIEFFASEKDGRNVVAAPSQHPNVSDLYLVDADGRNKERIAENDGRTLYWVLNKANRPVLRADRPEEDESVTRFFIASKRESNGWSKLADVSINDTFAILEVAEDLTHAFALSSRGRDKSALVRVSLPDMSETVLAKDPQGDI
jgi:hypothetical protein